ncbi:MAG TPA: site-2 protease family protein [Bryobacteraceae bacterium]|nr:site-2 protease family protein [Bryobacteraceae bacterium]
MFTDRVTELAREAVQCTQAGEFEKALAAWRQALPLVPPGSADYQQIAAAIQQLILMRDRARASAPKKPLWNRIRELGPAGLILLFLGKAKFLLLGLSKASTFFSMLLSFGLYFSIWGWKYALGLLLCIYVHEMGHVAALIHYGIPASPPMFVPGFGAYVRLHQYPANPAEDARVGLAGPLWGLGATIVAYLVWAATGWQSWGAVAQSSAWINLFNLLPVWQLDGGRGFRALSKYQRWMVALVAGMMFFATSEGMLLFIVALAIFQAWKGDAPETGDPGVVMQFAFLIVTLSLLAAVPIGTLTRL